MPTTQRPQRARKSFPPPETQEKENDHHRTRAKRAQSMGGSAIPFKDLVLKPADDGLSPRRRMRRSMVPRKSILKMKNADEFTQDFTMAAQTAPLPSFASQDFTTMTNFESSVGDDRRKSLARRVSFASHAHVRLFPKEAAKGGSDTASPHSSEPSTPSSPDTPSSPESASSPALHSPPNDNNNSVVISAPPPPDSRPSTGHRRRPSMPDASALLDQAGVEDADESSMDVDDDTTASREPFSGELAVGFVFPRTSMSSAAGDDMDVTSAFGAVSQGVDDTTEHTASTKSSEGPAEFLVALGKNVPSSAPNGRPSLPTSRDMAWDALEAIVHGVNNDSSDDEGDMELIDATGRIDAVRRASIATALSEMDMDVEDATGRILDGGHRRPSDASQAEQDMELDDSSTDEGQSMDDEHADKTANFTDMFSRMSAAEHDDPSAHAPVPAPAIPSFTLTSTSIYPSLPPPPESALESQESALSPVSPSKRRQSLGSALSTPQQQSPKKTFTAAFAPSYQSPRKRPASPAPATPSKRQAIGATPTKATPVPSAKKLLSGITLWSPAVGSRISDSPSHGGSPIQRDFGFTCQREARLQDIAASSPRRVRSPAPATSQPPSNASFPPSQSQPSVLQGLEDISGIIETNDEFDDIPVRMLTINEFLEMTGVTFMDGLNVKRRSTVGPGVLGVLRNQDDDVRARPLSDYVSAAAVGIPQLEMYLWACQELRKNIATGQETVQLFEEQVENNNPILFREYLVATEDERPLMEQQLKIMKAHARLSAKEKWYQWRQGLVQDLHNTVLEHLTKLQSDNDFIQNSKAELETSLPQLRERHAALAEQLQQERKNILEIEGDSPDQLRELREGISEQNTQIDGLKVELAEVATKTERVNAKLSDLEDQRKQALTVISKSEQQCRLLRSCTRSEVFRLKEEYEALQRMYLWEPVKLSPEETLLTYDSSLQVKIMGDKRTLGMDGIQLAAGPSPNDKEIMASTQILCRMMQHKLKSLPTHNVPQILHRVACMWTAVTQLHTEIRLVRLKYPISVTPSKSTKPAGLAVTAHILLPSRGSKVDLSFLISADALAAWPASASDVVCSAELIYGDISLDRVLQVARARLAEANERQFYGCLADVCREAALAEE